MEQSLEQRNYNAIVSLRLAIIFNGMKIEPNPAAAMTLAFHIGSSGLCDSMLKDPKSARWNLYDYDPDLNCAIHAVMCPGWLVNGADALVEGPLKMGEIHPNDWIVGLRETFNKLPTHLIGQQESQDLLDWFLQRYEATPPELTEAIHGAILAKARAIANGESCEAGEGEEEDEDPPASGTFVVVIHGRKG